MPRKTIRVEPMNAIKEEKHNEQPQETSSLCSSSGLNPVGVSGLSPAGVY